MDCQAVHCGIVHNIINCTNYPYHQMQDAVEMKYCVQPDINHVLEWSKSLIGLFVDTSRFVQCITTNYKHLTCFAGLILVVDVQRNCHGYLKGWS